MTTAKRWSYKAGEKGRNRVRVYEDRPGGPLLAEFRQDGQKRRVSLGHSDRTRAKQEADKMVAAFGQTGQATGSDPTLATLFDIYLREVTPAKGVEKQNHDRTCAKMFLGFLGEGLKAKALNRRHWDAFISNRLSSEVTPGKSRGQHVGLRTVEYDLKFLMAVLNWAVTAANRSGHALLIANPLKGLRYPKETAPKRPVLRQAQYEALLAIAPGIDWRFGVALVLANETGHRRKAIASLRWSDVDLEAATVMWRASTDKVGFEHEMPLTAVAVEAFKMARAKGQGIGEAWVLPSPRDPSQPCSEYILRDWMERAKEAADVDVPRIGWHSLRRKFATELKETPLVDVCAVGGWKDPTTLLRCYQQADQATMRRALEGRVAK